MTDETRLDIGSNLPPADANPLRERLKVEYSALTLRQADLLASAGRALRKSPMRMPGG